MLAVTSQQSPFALRVMAHPEHSRRGCKQDVSRLVGKLFQSGNRGGPVTLPSEHHLRQGMQEDSCSVGVRQLCEKGQPNMTITNYCRFVYCETLHSMSLPSGFPRQISLETARKFLLDLGFQTNDVRKKAVI